MKNKILLLIVVVLSVIAISGSKKETTYFNNAKKEEVKEEIKLALKDTSTGEIKNIELEDYIVGVVAGEMPASFNEEALKAQAIAARTYAMYKMKNSNGTYDLVTDKTNQVYITEDKMKSLWQENFDYYFEKIKKAVYDTKDLIMTYNGDIILSLYFARSNGKTEDAIAVFGSNEEYLKSVESPEENLTSEVTISKDKFCNKLNISCDAINISNVLKSSSGRINSLNINGKTFKGTEIRTLFDLKSTDFDISIGSEIKFVTKGYGHGVGMSQYGANKLAQNGKNYEEILKHYYQNINIEKISV
ncbi:MAG: stage II sporulation protein D [Firmicutes bacterium]|mgnify:FL=1|jgi:stage II sporulation protein D|nr:stage II sporulation protein D [Bacillota bacterium]